MKVAIGAAYILALVVGTWWVRSLPDTGPAPVVVAAPDAHGTMAVNVNVTLLEPTATRTPIPTVEPTRAPTRETSINWCGSPEPGRVCQMPPAATATATAYPDCTEATAGEWCVWPTTETPA